MDSVINTKDIVFDDEKEESVAPSKVEQSPLSTSSLLFEEESSTLGDLGTGAAQGLTFGFSDEAIAAAKALADVAVSKEKELKDLPSLYRQLQQIEQQKIKEAKERSPISFTAGEIGGGILPALFTGGGTAAASAAKGVLPAIGRGAMTGAKYGAVAAAGTAEAPIEETGELAKEIGKGALFGGTLGGVLGGAGELGRKLLPDVEDVKSLRQAKLAYEEGKAGRGYAGEAAETAALSRESGEVLKLEEQIFNTKDVLGKRIETVLDDAEKAGKIIEADPASLNAASDMMTLLESKPGLFGKEESKILFDQLQKLESDALSPKEANDLRRLVKDKLFKIQDKADVETTETLSRFKDVLQNKLNDIKGFSEANKDFSTFLRSTAETIYGKGKPVAVLKGYLSEKTKPEERLFADLETIIRKARSPGSRGDTERKTLIQLQENLAKMEAEKPGFLKSIGFDPQEFLSTIKKEADISTVGQIRRGYEPQPGVIKSLLGAHTPLAALYSGAEYAGKIVGKTTGSTPVRLASKVYSAAEPELRKVSDRLLQNSATKKFGENLAKSLDAPGGVARRAILFSIMQNPEARKAIADLYPGVGEE